jgi:hypothetical protein
VLTGPWLMAFLTEAVAARTARFQLESMDTGNT